VIKHGLHFLPLLLTFADLSWILFTLKYYIELTIVESYITQLFS
jgi:hypothetical protein